MPEELRISALVEYYVQRYNLDSKGLENGKKRYEKYKTYKMEISRILQKTYISGSSLWDIIGPKNGDKTGVRKISIEEFERQCFPQWAEYIRKCNDFDEEALKEDEERYLAYYMENKKWREVAERALAQHNAAIENEDGDPDDYVYGVTIEDVKAKGHEMMLEAIYNIFYGPFQWEKLKADMEAADVNYDGYNPEITPEMEKAKSQLEDYKNYTGEPKQKT